MPSQTVQGVVLRFANYRDHDRMLTILSPQHGRLEVLSRGCRRPKSPLLPASELFVHGEFVLFQTKDRYSLTSCAITDTFYPLRLDHDRLTYASYLLGLCQAAAQPGEDATQLYALLLQGLYLLAYDTTQPPRSITSSFLLQYAGAIGYKPRMNHCAHCRTTLDTTESAYLDVPAGGLVCPSCGERTAYRLRGDQVAWMREVLQNGFGLKREVMYGKTLAAQRALQTGSEEEGQQKTDASDLFPILRRYVESRLDATIKVSKLLP